MTDFDLNDLTDDEQRAYEVSRMRVRDSRDPAYDGPECAYCGTAIDPEEYVEHGACCEDCQHEIDMEAHASFEGAAR